MDSERGRSRIWTGPVQAFVRRSLPGCYSSKYQLAMSRTSVVHGDGGVPLQPVGCGNDVGAVDESDLGHLIDDQVVHCDEQFDCVTAGSSSVNAWV